MTVIPKKVGDRFASELGRFQRILQSSKDRDVNESDTVIIVTDLLSSLFGYDKYTEVTSELAVRCTYCDLAVKVDGAIKFIIEVKAIGLNLKDNHLKQAVDYAANLGVDWVVLTNGVIWSIHRVRFERPVSSEPVCEFNMLELSARRQEDQDRLYLICREGIAKAAIEEFHQHRLTVNRFMIGQIVLSAPVLDTVRRELRRVSPAARTEIDEIEGILRTEVLKRDVIEGDSAAQAKNLLRKASSRALRTVKTKAADGTIIETAVQEEASTVEQVDDHVDA